MANASVPAPHNTRSYDRRQVKTLAEQFAADLCREVGIRYRGIMPGFDNGRGKVIPPQILADNSFGSTFCVPLTGATIETIRAEFDRSNAAWTSNAPEAA